MLNLCIYSVSNFVFNAQKYDVKKKSNEFSWMYWWNFVVVVFFSVYVWTRQIFYLIEITLTEMLIIFFIIFLNNIRILFIIIKSLDFSNGLHFNLSRKIKGAQCEKWLCWP